jgi:Na+-driven multidrug efflux pump
MSEEDRKTAMKFLIGFVVVAVVLVVIFVFVLPAISVGPTGY